MAAMRRTEKLVLGNLSLCCQRRYEENAGNEKSKFVEKAGEFVSSTPAVRRAKVKELWCGV